jgi:hypothetical protein
MRHWPVICLFGAALWSGVQAQTMGPPPTAPQSRAAAMLSEAGPRTRAFVAEESQASGLTEAGARQAALSDAAALGATSPQDIDALAAMILLQASENADAELRDMQAQMQSINAQKQRLREQQAQMQAAEASAKAQAGPAVANMSRPDAIAPQSPAPVIVHPAASGYGASGLRPVPPQIPQNPKGRLDSMSDMGEMESMRLQMAMDRRSKFLEALSNIMKKISDTDATIAQNLK